MAVGRLSDVGMLRVSILRGIVVDIDVDVDGDGDGDGDTEWMMLSMILLITS